MKTVASFVLILALLAVSNVGLAQDQSSPENVVKLFKACVDRGLISNMLALCTDVDAEGPLQFCNYPRLVESMQTYSSAWANRSFVFDKQEIRSESSVVVYFYSPDTHQQIKFYLRSFDDVWYIDDIEVYDNAG